jgi:hypothetical protein
MTEFFISSVSCCPGGQRFHLNICSNNFKDAILNAQNPDPYNVFWYGYDMFVWYYKYDGTEFKLMKKINMNSYIKGALLKNKKGLRLKNNPNNDLDDADYLDNHNKKSINDMEEYEIEEDNFIFYDKLEKRKGTWKEGEEINYELYKTVVYSDIEEIVITDPLPENTRVYIKLPTEKKISDKNNFFEDKNNSSSVEDNSFTDKKYLFMVKWGYMWEDSSNIIYFEIFNSKLSKKEKEKCFEINENIVKELKEEEKQKNLLRRKELLSIPYKNRTDEINGELSELRYKLK